MANSKRRLLTDDYKRNILAEIDGSGSQAEVLKRERLYSTQVKQWREQLGTTHSNGNGNGHKEEVAPPPARRKLASISLIVESDTPEALELLRLG